MVPQPRAPAPPIAPDRDDVFTVSVEIPFSADDCKGENNAEKCATVEDVNPQQAVSESADFESAMAATGYGRFHVLLLLVCLPAFWSAVSVTSSVSYIFSSAKCDMSLSLVDMGTINAITYGGMISSAMVWGFLSDTLGRRRIMVWGFLSAGLLEVLAAASQNFAMLLVMRFLAGFLFNGPLAVLLSYLAELHRTELRARVMLYTCLFYTAANTTLPLLAWAILVHDFQFTILPGYIEIRTWNVFLLATGLVPLLTALACARLPESPKFLMSRGRDREALQVFRHIFSANTGRPPHEYPIKSLKAEKSGECARGSAALRDGFRQLTPLFRPPHLLWLLLLCTVHAGVMLGSNTLRLWFPQLAAMLEAGAGRSLCESVVPTPTRISTAAATVDILTGETCVTTVPGPHTYLQSMAVGSASLLTYVVGGLLVNRCGKKMVCGACTLCCACAAAALPALSGAGATSAVVLVAVFLSLASLSGAALSSVVVDLFPTDLRVMAMATFLMCGRLGTIAGNVAFPALLQLGCIPPFATISTVMFACGVASFLLPTTTLKKLQ